MKTASASFRRLTIESLELRRVLAAGLSCPAVMEFPSSHAGLMGELVAAPQLNLTSGATQLAAFAPDPTGGHEMAGGESPHAHQDDANAVSAMHMQHHNIPDFAKDHTHFVSESGNWSNLAALADVDANSIVVIGEGVTVVYDRTDVQVKAIGVYGTLRFATDVNTEIKLQELLVYGSGYLELGTQEQPIGSDVSATITIGDRPLNLASDPTEAGNGVIVLGKLRIYGHQLQQTFVNLTTSPQTGDRVLNVSQVPAGWRVGDVISLPQTMANARQALTEEFTITALTATSLSLNKAVGFDRPPAMDGELTTVTKGFDGQELRGQVANLSRNVTIRSQNPQGNRGHFMAIGTANVDIRYGAFAGLGRTKIGGDDPTILDADGQVVHQGTNQIGRYSLHFHHLSGPTQGLPVDPAVDPAGIDARQYRVIGNAITDGEKWGITIHNTHFGLVTDNVVHRVHGAGIITEEGSESYNYIAHNFSFGLKGTSSNGRFDKFGDRGSTYWARSGHNYWVNNVAAAAEEGFGLYSTNDFGNVATGEQVVRVPKFSGATTMKAGDYLESKIRNLPLLKFDNNQLYAIKQFGVGSWVYVNDDLQVPPPTFTKTAIWNTTGTGVYLDYNSAIFDQLIIRGSANNPLAFAIRGHNAGYATHFKNFDIQLANHVFYEDSRAVSNITFENGYSRNYDGFGIASDTQAVGDRLYVFRNVKFDAVPGHPLVAIRTTINPSWTRGESYAGDVTQTIRVLVYGYQGDPTDNFRLYFNEQAADYTIGSRVTNNLTPDFRRAPEEFFVGGSTVQVRLPEQLVLGETPNQTNADSMAVHREAILREVAPSDAVRRPGLIGVAAPISAHDVPAAAPLAPLPAFYFQNGTSPIYASTVDLVYKDFAARGADSILFRLDDGPWIPETDNDGRFRLLNVPVGTHRLESALAGPSGQPWGTRVIMNFFVLDAAYYVSFGPIADHSILISETQQQIQLAEINGGSADSPLRFEAISQNPAIIVNPQVDFNYGDSTGTLRYTVGGTAGTTGVTVTLRSAGPDGQFNTPDDVTSQQSFTVVVVDPNAPPIPPVTPNPGPGDSPWPDTPGEVSFAPISDAAPVASNAGEQAIRITGINSGPGGRSLLLAISSGSHIVNQFRVAYTHGHDSATLYYTPTGSTVGRVDVDVRLLNAGADGAYLSTDDLLFHQFVGLTITAPNIASPAPAFAPAVDYFAHFDSSTAPTAWMSDGTGIHSSHEGRLGVSDTSGDVSAIADVRVAYQPGDIATLYVVPLAGPDRTTPIEVLLGDVSDHDTLFISDAPFYW